MTFVGSMRGAVAVRRDQQVTTWGQVSVASPLEVIFAGDTAGERVELKLAAYAPVVGHKVALARVGTQWVCLGQIGAA